MDGSLHNNGNDLNSITPQIVFKSNLAGKSVNPVKEGLSDTTLNILKSCLKVLKAKHEENIRDDK